MTESTVKPNFIIIEAAKYGTTSLHRYLQSHPEIYMQDLKEPCYFAQPWPQQEGLPETEEEYLELFKDGEDKVAVGEASANYLFVPGTAECIFKSLGHDVKLIVMLRNPVSMMFSLWEHAFCGYGERRNAREALLSSRLDEPLTEADRKLFGTKLYGLRANYVKHLKSYFDIFPRKNIKVFIFEEFFKPDLPQYGALCRFLGVSDNHQPVEDIQNKGVGIRSRSVIEFFRHYYPKYVFPVLKYLAPHVVRRNMKEMIFSTAKKIENRKHESVRNELESRLNDSVRELEKLVGRDLSGVWF